MGELGFAINLMQTFAASMHRTDLHERRGLPGQASYDRNVTYLLSHCRIFPLRQFIDEGTVGQGKSHSMEMTHTCINT